MKTFHTIIIIALWLLLAALDLFAGDVWLAWDASPSAAVTNYTLYGTTNATLTAANLTNAQLRVNVGTNLLAHVESISTPKLWRFGVTAQAGGAQSDLSNILPVDFPAPPANSRVAAIQFGIDLTAMTNHAFFRVIYPATP